MTDPTPNRRTFLMHGSAAVAASAALNLGTVAHAAGSDRLKVGLVGCGGRGTGAAEEALKADKNVSLVAMADAFPDRLADSLSTLKGLSEVADRVDVPAERQYNGFDAYKQVIDQVDVVLLTTPPGFRPIHLAYAVQKGVHAFVEKPIAVDGPGVRSFIKSAEEAKVKGLSLVAGLCWRYHNPRVETMKRVRDGAIGKIVAIETIYNSGGVWDPRKSRDEVKSEMEYQMRNWYYYDWLSGDHIVEQAVHAIDTMGWALGDEPPVKCWGSGGRQVRTDPKYGNIFDHFNVVYEYADGTRGYLVGGRKSDEQLHHGHKGGLRRLRPQDHRREPLALSRAEQQHVPGRARRPLRLDPGWQAAQRRSLRRAEQPAGDHGPRRRLHRRGDHLGQGVELKEVARPRRVCLGRRTDAAGPAARCNQVRLMFVRKLTWRKRTAKLRCPIIGRRGDLGIGTQGAGCGCVPA
jgi:predicted dehydrogenase